MKRTLSLKRESLAQLTDAELDSVAGGATGKVCPGITSLVHPWCPSAFTCPTE